MITAALEGKLKDVQYEAHPIFGVQMPTSCPQVPAELLNPRNTWTDKSAYDLKANQLAEAFVANFEKYRDGASEAILSGAPRVMAM
jgi:phosphoenolpyruvate carboxykinase (ATP)